MQLKDLLAGGGFNKSFPQGGASASLPGMNGGIGGGLPQRGAPSKPTTLKEIIGIISDGMLGFAGANPIYGPAKLRQQEEQDRFQQQYDLAEREAEQQRANKRWEWENKPEEPTADMRNFEWYESATPQQRALYDQFKPVITSTWQGPQAVPRSSLGPPTAPVGKLTPITPTMQNTPAPQMNASGNPTFLTPDQYRVTVEALGQERTDDWMRRNNIRIGGQ